MIFHSGSFLLIVTVARLVKVEGLHDMKFELDELDGTHDSVRKLYSIVFIVTATVLQYPFGLRCWRIIIVARAAYI